MERDFHSNYGGTKPISIPRIWFLRIHDYGFGWLHIHELVNDLFYGFQGKFLKIFRR